GARRPLLREETGEAFDGELTQPLALAHEPVFEAWRLGAESGQQVAAVQRGRRLERRRRVRGHGLLERGYVRPHRISRPPERIARHDQRGALVWPERLTEDEQGLAERVASRGWRRLAPEQRRQFVPGMSLARREREVRQERLCLSRRHGERLPTAC